MLLPHVNKSLKNNLNLKWLTRIHCALKESGILKEIKYFEISLDTLEKNASNKQAEYSGIYLNLAGVKKHGKIMCTKIPPIKFIIPKISSTIIYSE